MERAARLLFFVAMGLFGAFLALLSVQGLLVADLLDQGFELQPGYWNALGFAAGAAVLCALDLTALLFAIRGRALLARYRRERDDWREAREAMGPLLRRR